MWSRKLIANFAYSEGSPPNFISSIFGSEEPCLSASATVNHGAMSALVLNAVLAAPTAA